MGSVWEGDDYIAFVTQMKGFTDDCQGMVTSMKKYSDFLKQSARIYRDTQKEIITAREIKREEEASALFYKDLGLLNKLS